MEQSGPGVEKWPGLNSRSWWADSLQVHLSAAADTAATHTDRQTHECQYCQQGITSLHCLRGKLFFWSVKKTKNRIEKLCYNIPLNAFFHSRTVTIYSPSFSALQASDVCPQLVADRNSRKHLCGVSRLHRSRNSGWNHCDEPSNQSQKAGVHNCDPHQWKQLPGACRN